MIKAAGHYKETQSNYIIAMILNIFISIITVKAWGLVGVSIGTLIAMLYQTIWMAWYNSKNIIQWNFLNFIKQLFVDILTVSIAVFLTNFIPDCEISYLSWFVQAIEVFICWVAVTLIINMIFYKRKIFQLFNKLIRKKRGII